MNIVSNVEPLALSIAGRAGVEGGDLDCIVFSHVDTHNICPARYYGIITFGENPSDAGKVVPYSTHMMNRMSCHDFRRVEDHGKWRLPREKFGYGPYALPDGSIYDGDLFRILEALECGRPGSQLGQACWMLKIFESRHLQRVVFPGV